MHDDDITFQVKAAVRRREGYPVGQPAPCYLVCQCGAELDITDDEFDWVSCATCNHLYDKNGWLITGRAK